ncbi:MAG TPA: hypothetical protein VLE73_00245 [Candidatus Saccharimonadales bacterium]|nr:hypothetical protein [Candidatus Saccharimonadales bacterium]
MRNQSESQSWRPHFIREIREHAEREGILQATHDLLVRDNVTVHAKGSVDLVKNHEGGMLFIGNHNRQFEFVALMDVLSQIGRTSMKNIVKFYVQNQVTWALGDVGTGITLPVYPRLLDRDRNNKWNAELVSRLWFHRSLQPAVDARRLTDDTLAAASAELVAGGVVNIFPCGSVVNNIKKPWREGVGRIVQSLPKESRPDVLVVPYHADSIRRARLLVAVAARGSGILGRPQTIDVTFGLPQTAAEVMRSTSGSVSPAAITEELRRHYVGSFEEL